MTKLRGPLEADLFRTTRYRQRWYVDPLKADDTWPERSGKDDVLPAFSTIKRIHKGTFRKRYGDQTYDLDALRCALYVAEQKEHLLRLDDAGIVAAVAPRPSIELNKAGSRGTGVHAMFEGLADGQSFDRNWLDVYHPESIDYYDVVMKFWSEMAPEIGFSEVVGMNWEIGYSCTADATDVVFTGPTVPAELVGKHLAIDFKTRSAGSNHGVYMEEAMQLAAAAFVEYAFVQNDDGSVVRQAPPKLDMGVIVSIKPDSFELFPVDLSKAWDGWVDTCDAWRLAKSGAKHGRSACGDSLFIQPPSVTPEPEVADPATETSTPTPDIDPTLATVTEIFPDTVEVQSDPFAGLPSGEGSELNVDRAKMTTWLRDRAIALEGIIPEWPKDVPTFKAMAGELHSVDQLKAIEHAILAAESKANIVFPEQNPGDPTVPADDPRVVALVDKVKGFNEAQLETYKAATASITGAKPTSGLCTETRLAEYEDVVNRMSSSWDEAIDAANAKHPGVFRNNGIVWVVDQETAVIDLVGGKRELLKRGRALSPGATIRNANEVLGDVGLVARILLEETA